MADKTSIKGFLKGILGLGEARAKPIKTTPPVELTSLEAAQPMTAPTPPKPKTEAYLNRKKGRRPRGDTMEYWKNIIACIERKGEVAPGEIARELGIPKSTLIYNLNRLLDLCQGVTRQGDHHIFLNHVFSKILGGKRLVRIGAGKYVRYKLEAPPTQREGPQ